jgi:hypothetical protein
LALDIRLLPQADKKGLPVLGEGGREQNLKNVKKIKIRIGK